MRRYGLALFIASWVCGAGYGQSFIAYDNTQNFLGAAFSNGGTGAGITRLVADDITPDPAFQGGGWYISRVVFSVFNGSTNAVTIRPRLRFWFADGAGNSSGVNDPGTYYTPSNPIGYTFNPLSVNPGTVSLFQFSPAPFAFQLPPGTFWAGITFDNVGATASAADTDLFGQGIFGPPTVGSTLDTAFRTTATGSFFSPNNPAGSQFTFGGQDPPPANFGWLFEVTAIPEPTTVGLFGLLLVGAVPAIRRYRQRQQIAALDLAEAKARFGTPPSQE